MLYHAVVVDSIVSNAVVVLLTTDYNIATLASNYQRQIQNLDSQVSHGLHPVLTGLVSDTQQCVSCQLGCVTERKRNREYPPMLLIIIW